MITFRRDFQKMKDKLTGITASIFNEMSDSVETALTSLSTKIDNTIDSLGMRGTWNDNVSVEINGGVRTGIKSVIESCKNPACELIDSIGVNAESLFMKLTEYLQKWSEYLALLKEKADLAAQEPPETIYNEKTKDTESNPEWKNWKEKMDLLEFAIQSMEVSIRGVESFSDSLINTLKSLLVPISSATKAVLSSLGKSQEEVVGETTKVSNRTINTDGSVTESYVLYDKIGNEIGVGNVKYDEMGNKIIEEYSVVQKDGSRKNATITYKGNEATEVSSVVKPDGTIVQNTTTFTANNVVSEDVKRLLEETNKTPETVTNPPKTEETVQTVAESSKQYPGLTEKEIKFLNEHSKDDGKLRLCYNGEEIPDNSKIKIKEGETIQILVKIPTNEGEHINLCRATAGGGSTWKNGIKQSNSVSPNRYDKNSILEDTGYYVWTITGTKAGAEYQISQTAQFNTERQSYYNSEKGNGAFKEMCRLYITVE